MTYAIPDHIIVDTVPAEIAAMFGIQQENAGDTYCESLAISVLMLLREHGLVVKGSIAIEVVRFPMSGVFGSYATPAHPQPQALPEEVLQAIQVFTEDLFEHYRFAAGWQRSRLKAVSMIMPLI